MSADDAFVIAGRRFGSRLMVGTGKYRDAAEMRVALEASGAEVVTVAIGRLNLDRPGERTLLDEIDWSRYFVLPNTAGARTAEEAVRIARLGRAVTGSDWVKLEVIPDPTYLLPDPVDTLEAARELLDEGFVVLPYIHADPVLAKRLEAMGTATVMPLGSPIGSGQGLRNRASIELIVAQAGVPVVVDAGIGSAADAAEAMELGADACLVNTAIAQARDPELMAHAIRLGVEAGRKAYHAGRIPVRAHASASSPLERAVR